MNRELKAQLARQPTYDVHDEIRNLREEIKKKNRGMSNKNENIQRNKQKKLSYKLLQRNLNISDWRINLSFFVVYFTLVGEGRRGLNLYCEITRNGFYRVAPELGVPVHFLC